MYRYIVFSSLGCNQRLHCVLHWTNHCLDYCQERLLQLKATLCSSLNGLLSGAVATTQSHIVFFTERIIARSCYYNSKPHCVPHWTDYCQELLLQLKATLCSSLNGLLPCDVSTAQSHIVFFTERIIARYLSPNWPFLRNDCQTTCMFYRYALPFFHSWRRPLISLSSVNLYIHLMLLEVWLTSLVFGLQLWTWWIIFWCSFSIVYPYLA